MPKEVGAAVSAAIFSIEQGTARSTRNLEQEMLMPIPHPPPVANTRDIRLWAIDRLTPLVSARR